MTWDPRIEGTLNAFPLRIDWELANPRMDNARSTEPIDRSMMPVTAREALPGDPLPRSAVALRNDLRVICRGRVRVVYSRGVRVINAGRANERQAEVDVVAVQAWTGDASSVVVWVDGKQSVAMVKRRWSAPEHASTYAVLPVGGKARESGAVVIRRLMREAAEGERTGYWSGWTLAE